LSRAVSHANERNLEDSWHRALRGARTSLGVVAALFASGCSPAAPLNFLASRQGLQIDQSIPYAEGARHTLDVYRPEGVARAPVVVFFYGGSWQSGSKETYVFAAAALAHRGYVVIVPDYRIYPDAKYPAFLEDGARAVAWAKRNARRFGGDPGKLLIMGHSAGAYIAAMLAIDPRWLKAAGVSAHRDIAGLVGLSGPYDFLPLRDRTLKVIFGGATRADTQPINYVTGGEPPALLATGGGDTIVDPGNSRRLADKLRTAGDRAEVIMYPHRGHLETIGAFAPSLQFLAPVLNDVDSFIKRTAAARKSAS
jgi:acetyl esterase/lipase